jgi:hypothetical protein
MAVYGGDLELIANNKQTPYRATGDEGGGGNDDQQNTTKLMCMIRIYDG